MHIDIDQTTGCVYVMDRSLGGKVIRFGRNGASETVLTMANVLGTDVREIETIAHERSLTGCVPLNCMHLSV